MSRTVADPGQVGVIGRWFSTILALAALAATLVLPAGSAAQPPKRARVGMLFLGSPATQANRVTIVRDGLRDMGWVEGQNVAFEVRWAEGRVERASELATELVRLNPDVIVTSGTPLIRALQQATSTIPIVVQIMGDPVVAGFAASFARPGGNITGGAFQTVELNTKRLELLTEMLPKLSRVAALLDPQVFTTRSVAADFRRVMEDAARALKVKLQFLEVRGPDDFERAFEDARRGRAEALLQIASGLFGANRDRLAELTRRSQLPWACEIRESVVAGCLFSYGPDIDTMVRRVPFYVDRILRGTKPGDLPIEQPTRFELILNLRTAKALGLTIPQPILARADELIR